MVLSLRKYRPLKRLKRRIELWLLLAIVGLLLDEYLKEGYIFDPSDMLKPLTHENIAIILLIVLVLYHILCRYLRLT